MFDNVDLNLSYEEAPGVDLLHSVPARLTRQSETTFSDGTVLISGYLSSIKVRVTGQAVKIHDSSICKWYLGDNFQALSRGDTKKAIQRLSDELRLPMDRAAVTRVDVAQNFIMRHEKTVYFDHLGSLQYFNRLQQNNGLYYTNGNNTLVFYEKVHEQTIKGQAIPEMYRAKTCLRYEQRYKRRLLQTFNRPELRAADLYEPGLYCELVNRWKGEYQKIKKLNDIQINYSMIKTKKDQANQAILWYVSQRGGEQAVINEIKEAYKRGELKKSQAHDLRQQVEEACKCKSFTSSSDVILELDKKVKEAARFYL
ncbi:MAG: hypothetical protein PHP04_02600 [Bacteroidales bacterium]|nr:hypothetical protein [Bacteroidales bacterium]